MKLPEPDGKVLLYHHPVDLRKSYRSLAYVVEQELKCDSKNGDAYIFINKAKTLSKVLWSDRTGWCLRLKRLSAARYRVTGKNAVHTLELGHSRYFFDGL